MLRLETDMQVSRQAASRRNPVDEARKPRSGYEGHGEVISLYAGRGWLLYLDFIFRFWMYWDTYPNTVNYFSALGFFVGGLCFMIGTFSALLPSVQSLRRPLSCGADGYSWWTAFPYLLGDILWQIACSLQIVQSLNSEYTNELEAWEASSEGTSRPRYRWLGARPTSLEWWGATLYDVGVAIYLMTQLFTYMSMCPGMQLSDDLYAVLIDYPVSFAGLLFFIAGTLYIPVLGSASVLPNILLPFRREDWVSRVWWAVWLYFWGGFGFFVSGLFLCWYSPKHKRISDTAYRIESSIGFGGGSTFFMLGALLLLMQQSSERCRPSKPAQRGNAEIAADGEDQPLVAEGRRETRRID